MTVAYLCPVINLQISIVDAESFVVAVGGGKHCCCYCLCYYCMMFLDTDVIVATAVASVTVVIMVIEPIIEVKQSSRTHVVISKVHGVVKLSRKAAIDFSDCTVPGVPASLPGVPCVPGSCGTPGSCDLSTI